MSTSSHQKPTSTLLLEADLTSDQVAEIDALYAADASLVVCEMGGGKTTVTLSAIKDLLEAGVIDRVLVIAPIKVINTVWREECNNWEHLTELDVACATGSPEERKAAFTSNAPLVGINFENIAWAVDEGLLESFDALVVDESTKLKAGGAGFKKLRRKLPQFRWRVALTGTPVSEGLEYLFYQIMLLDDGARLGKNKMKFLMKYFYPTDFQRRNWAVLPNMEAALVSAVSDLIHVMPSYTHTLPPLTVKPLEIYLPDFVKARYRELSETMTLGTVICPTAAVLSNKLSQVASGFIYTDEGPLHIHAEKVRNLSSIIGKTVVENGDTLMVVYQYDWELKQIESVLNAQLVKYKILANDTENVVKEWNAGRVDVLVLHPKSGGHGLNLARGGHNMLWFGPCWSRDLFDQTIARLWRRGQRFEVLVEVLSAVGTVDYIMLGRLDIKGAYLPRLLSLLAKVPAHKKAAL